MDAEDYNRLAPLQWRVLRNGKNFYAIANIVYVGRSALTVSMHRMIMSFPEGMSVDHINGNGLDNRKENLRICRHIDNCKNRRKNYGKHLPKGVTRVKRNDRILYSSRITSNRKVYNLGYFSDPELAKNAYEKKSIELHGEFSRKENL